MAYRVKVSDEEAQTVEGIVESAAGTTFGEGGGHMPVTKISLRGHDDTYQLAYVSARIERGERVRIHTCGGRIGEDIKAEAVEILDDGGNPKFAYAEDIADICWKG